MNAATTPISTGASTASAEAPPRFDFPGWLPPMLVKELRQGLRQRGFVGGLIGAQALLVVVFLIGFASEVVEGSSRSMINGFFWSTMFGVLLLVGPFRALGALHAEIDARTMDLLLLTRLDSWRIVWGKWVSLMTQSLLLVVSLLPYAVVRYFFGSVEIVQDIVLIGVLLVMGGVFTAVGLWASGMNRILRLLLIIGAVLMSFGVLGNILSRSMITGRMIWGDPFSGTLPEWVAALVFVWVSACVIAYSLMLAVRWFAPLAENHAIGPRLIPLALVAPVPLLAWLGSDSDVAGYMAAFVVACGVIAAIELAGSREVMTIHLRGRLGRPGWRGAAGSLLLPGWESAARWLAVVLAILGASLAVIDWVSPLDLKAMSVCWLLILGWAGLVFPALLMSRLHALGRVSGLMYFILHGLFGALAGMAGSTTLSNKAPAFIRALEWVAEMVPPMSFWHAASRLDNSPYSLLPIGPHQALGVALTVALMWWLARPYWVGVGRMRLIARRSETRE